MTIEQSKHATHFSGWFLTDDKMGIDFKSISRAGYSITDILAAEDGNAYYYVAHPQNIGQDQRGPLPDLYVQYYGLKDKQEKLHVEKLSIVRDKYREIIFIEDGRQCTLQIPSDPNKDPTIVYANKESIKLKRITC